MLPAADGFQIWHHNRDQDWLVSWHPAASRPDGKNHGAAGLCVTPESHVVLITENGQDWDLPAGRPEPGETLRETLDREVLEEACCRVQEATLLGFVRGLCVRGHEEGLVLVRSAWRAEVVVGPWEPEFEIIERKILPLSNALPLLGNWPREVLSRFATEARMAT